MFDYMHPAKNMYRTSVFLLFNPSTETILSGFRLFLKYNILSVVLQTV